MTSLLARETPLVRSDSYGSETILILGQSAEMLAFCREALSRCGYRVLEAANLQHADTILQHFPSGPDLILAYTGSDHDGALAAWGTQHGAWPLLVLDPADYRTNPEVCAAEIGTRVRLALEAARPRRKILIVDDNEPDRRMLADLLESAGYQVSQASGGKEASALLATDTPELMLTEIVMQDVDGLQLLEDMRRRYPGVATIAMSGADRADHYLYVAKLLGAKGVLKKPLSTDQLLKLLREVQSPKNE